MSDLVDVFDHLSGLLKQIHAAATSRRSANHAQLQFANLIPSQHSTGALPNQG
jgi:hypothetical protein